MEDNEHPILTAIDRNPHMGGFDLQILVGNFSSEEAAMEYAEILKEFLEANAGAIMGRIQ